MPFFWTCCVFCDLLVILAFQLDRRGVGGGGQDVVNFMEGRVEGCSRAVEAWPKLDG